MDSRITIGDKLELKKIETELSENQNKKTPIYISQVLDESQNGEYLVSMPLSEGRVIPLSVGQEFYATFYSQKGLLQCQVEVTGRYRQEELFLMEITQKTILEKIQRREYFRLPCHQSIKYHVLSDTEQKQLEEQTECDIDEVTAEWKRGIMLDLSGGGIWLVSSMQEERNSIVQISFEITLNGKKERICAFAILLRSERNQKNQAVYDHHLMFWNMGQKVREKIIRFIFDEQRKNRAKEIGF